MRGVSPCHGLHHHQPEMDAVLCAVLHAVLSLEQFAHSFTGIVQSLWDFIKTRGNLLNNRYFYLPFVCYPTCGSMCQYLMPF